MYPSRHLIFGTLFGVVIFLIFPSIKLFGFMTIILSSVLIDVDHYLLYVKKKKDLSLRNSYKWFIENEKKVLNLIKSQRSEIYVGLCLFHGIEILLILIFLGIFISETFLFIFIGFSFHLILDFVDETTYHNRIDKFSLIYDFFKFKKLKYVEDYFKNE